MSRLQPTKSRVWKLGVDTLLKRPYRVIRGNRLGEFGALILVLLMAVALFGNFIAPYDPSEQHLTDTGNFKSLEEPSVSHPLGTTMYGRDVLSQLVVSTRVALFVGLVTAAITVALGTAAGLIAGYYGGYVDEIIMRIVDMIFGIPILPFAIVALTMLERSIVAIVLLLGFFYWRSIARVIRSECLSLKEEEFVQASKTTGASSLRIIYKQLLPNVLPLSFLYFAMAMGWAIIMAANIAFLGFGDPDQISWGRMIFGAWNNDAILRQPYWAATPGAMIVLSVASVYFVGRTYETVANPQLRERGDA